MLATCGWDIMREYEPQYPHLVRNHRGGEGITLGPRDMEPQEQQKVATPVSAPKTGKSDEKTDKFSAQEKKSAPKTENGIDIPQKRNYIDLHEIKLQLSGDECAIVDVLAGGQMHVDDIIAGTALPAGRVLASLTLLEVKGIVVQLPGKYFALHSK